MSGQYRGIFPSTQGICFASEPGPAVVVLNNQQSIHLQEAFMDDLLVRGKPHVWPV